MTLAFVNSCVEVTTLLLLQQETKVSLGDSPQLYLQEDYFHILKLWEDNDIMMDFSISTWNINLLMELLRELRYKRGCRPLFLFESQRILPPFQNLSFSLELVLLFQRVGDGLLHS